MAEPITIHLRSRTPLTGEGPINLTRDDFSATNGTFAASISAGGRISSGFFGFASAGEIKAVTVSASTTNPHDVVRVCFGMSIRSEHRLANGPQSVFVGPGEQLAFVTDTAVQLLLVVNILAESEHATLREATSPRTVRARLSRPGGFSSLGVMDTGLTWSDSMRIFEGEGKEGALPLATLDPRLSRFEGHLWRVRVLGCDGDAQAGVGSVLGDVNFEALKPGQWSRPHRVSHDDLLVVTSPGKRNDAATVVAEHELLPLSGFAPVVACETSEPGTAEDTPVFAGSIPLEAWINLSVNAAGAIMSNAGIELWTHGITGNLAGGFVGSGTGNKAMCGTHALDGMPLSGLT